MTYVHNLTGTTITILSLDVYEWGRLRDGEGAWFFEGEQAAYMSWTNEAGGLNYDSIHESEKPFALLKVFNPGYSTRTDLSWCYLVPLTLWALWLCSKMMLRIFARTFGASADNMTE